MIKALNSTVGRLISYKKTTAFKAIKIWVMIGKEVERTVSRIGNIQATRISASRRNDADSKYNTMPKWRCIQFMMGRPRLSRQVNRPGMGRSRNRPVLPGFAVPALRFRPDIFEGSQVDGIS